MLGRLFIILFIIVCSKHSILLAQPDMISGSYMGALTTRYEKVIYNPWVDAFYAVGHSSDSGRVTTSGAYKSNIQSITTPAGTVIKSDGFLQKISTDGRIIWSTYIGDNQDDYVYDIVCDKFGNIYISGVTFSDTNIATPSLEWSDVYPNEDTISAHFIMKFNTDGQKLWGRYFGKETEKISLKKNRLSIDFDNNLYLAGFTTSDTGFSTAGSYQPIHNPNSYDVPPMPLDGFIAKFDTAGKQLWGTYVGGEGRDIIDAIRCSPSDSLLYIVGKSSSRTGISTAGAFNEELGIYDTILPGDVFINCFNLDGERIWGTYFNDGYFSNMNLVDIAVDTHSNLYIYGMTTASGLGTAGSFQPYKDGNSSFFLMKFNKLGKRVWFTYYGKGTYSTVSHFELNLHGLHYEPIDDYIYMASKKISDEFYIDPTSCPYLFDTTDTNGYVSKFTTDGELEWASNVNIDVQHIAVRNNGDISVPNDIIIIGRTDMDSLADSGAFNSTLSHPYVANAFYGYYTEQPDCPENNLSIMYESNMLTTDTGYHIYNWYHNGVLVEVSGTPTYYITDTTGYYFVEAENSCMCHLHSDIFYFDDIGISNQDFAQHFQLFPNPTEHSIQLRVLNPNLSIKETDIYVYNLLGQSQAIKITQLGAQQYQIDLNDLPAGTYQILLRNQKGQWSQKVVKW